MTGHRCSMAGGDTAGPTPAVARVAATVTSLTMTVAFGLLALGIEWFWVAFVVGFGGVLPAAVGVTERRGGEGARHDGPDDALATLRRRYARGDLTDAEFERRVERLLETERADAHPHEAGLLDGPGMGRP